MKDTLEMQFDFCRKTRAKAHLFLAKALADQGDIGEAYAEVVSYAEFPGEILELARAVDCYLAAKAGGEPVRVDASALRRSFGAEANWALRLCGVRPVNKGRDRIWTDALNGEEAVPVTLPPDLLEAWWSDT